MYYLQPVSVKGEREREREREGGREGGREGEREIEGERKRSTSPMQLVIINYNATTRMLLSFMVINYFYDF